jgi:hypothetical protein
MHIRKNLCCLLSFTSFNLYHMVSKNYKLIIIQFSDSFLYVISTSTNSNYATFASKTCTTATFETYNI